MTASLLKTHGVEKPQYSLLCTERSQSSFICHELLLFLVVSFIMC